MQIMLQVIKTHSKKASKPLCWIQLNKSLNGPCMIIIILVSARKKDAFSIYRHFCRYTSVCSITFCSNTTLKYGIVYPPLGSESMETLEDIYIGSIETDRGTREQVRFYDTRGLRDGMEFPRHYYTFADGFVLVYSIDSKESFKRMEALKKDIDRHRDKKEVTIVVLGNKLDKQNERRVDANMAQNWAKNEKVRLWEVSVVDRRTLIEPFVYLASKMTQPQSKSTFPLSRNKNKGSGSTDS
ncbi:hypothetical protein fugu_015123 [Takifugu bimaculatus]|uniref:Small monomeric GTPase n=2 Tax=Takifugu TaxID=31032 RepID=A0A4Z2BYG5_9TELE|nr:hypothetical protein fugu_015123 [Takifugu bimaculatus]